VFQDGFEAAVVGPDLPPDPGGHNQRQEPEDAVGFGDGGHRDAGRPVFWFEAVVLGEPEQGEVMVPSKLRPGSKAVTW
jgi:hypothetical protein